WNDTMVEKYDIERFHDHPSPFVRYVEGKRIRRTFALLAPGPRDRVLEVGCGAGHLLKRLPAGRRFGLDLSESMLRKAQRRVDPGTLLQANAESLPFRTGAWERVYCSEVLEHVADPRAALAEIGRIAATPRPRSWLAALSSRWGDGDVRAVRRRIREWLRVTPCDRMLDAGCGAGELASLAPADYLGLDPDAAAVARARHRYRRDARKRFRVADAAALDLPRNFFDVGLVRGTA